MNRSISLASLALLCIPQIALAGLRAPGPGEQTVYQTVQNEAAASGNTYRDFFSQITGNAFSEEGDEVYLGGTNRFISNISIATQTFFNAATPGYMDGETQAHPGYGAGDVPGYEDFGGWLEVKIYRNDGPADGPGDPFVEGTPSGQASPGTLLGVTRVATPVYPTGGVDRDANGLNNMANAADNGNDPWIINAAFKNIQITDLVAAPNNTTPASPVVNVPRLTYSIANLNRYGQIDGYNHNANQFGTWHGTLQVGANPAIPASGYPFYNGTAFNTNVAGTSRTGQRVNIANPGQWMWVEYNGPRVSPTPWESDRNNNAGPEATIYAKAAALAANDSNITMDTTTQNVNLLKNAATVFTKTFSKTGNDAADWQIQKSGIDFHLVSGGTGDASIRSGTTATGPVPSTAFAYRVDTNVYDNIRGGAIMLDNLSVSDHTTDPFENFVFNARVGNAITGGTSFGIVMSGDVVAGGSYADLASRTSDGATNVTESGALVLGTEAIIRAGTNSSGPDETVSMQWRARTANEISTDEGGSPTYPPLSTMSGLVSDVVRVGGMLNGGANPDQTDVYVLQMTYDDASVSGSEAQEAFLASLGRIYLAWLDPEDSPPIGKWRNAVDGNEGTNTGATNFQGSWTAAGSPTALGAWGVDTVNNLVWAVVDHQGDFAAVPEPGTVILAGLALGTLLAVGTRRRRTA